MNLSELNEAIRQIRDSEPTLIVSHDDYDRIASLGLPAKVLSSTLVDAGEAFVIRAAA